MSLKIAYFQPTIIAAGPVPPTEFVKIFNLTEMLHSRPELNDGDDPTLSIRGGQQIQVYPNAENIDVEWLVKLLEEMCQGYMDLIGTQSATEDLKYCKPKIISIWTIRQEAGHYQEMHTHPAGHLSGNMYITAPDFNEGKASSDGQILFRLPQTRDITKFIMQDTWKYDPTPGTFILFPSHIPHTVYPFKGTGHRTVMAFDCQLVPNEQALYGNT
jgi:hypothetical protein